MENKVGIYYAFWEKNWLADYSFYAEKVASLGFDILELPAVALLELSQADIDKLIAIRDRTGIEYTFSLGLPQEYDISSNAETVRKGGIQYIKGLLKQVHKVDGKMFGGVCYAPWNGKMQDSKEAHRARSIKSLKEILPVAEDYGINYCVEVLNRFEQFIMNDHNEAIAFVQEVGSPNIKVELDTFHMNIEEDSFRQAILETDKLIGHVHIGEKNRKTPGLGSTPWDEIFGALKEINYQGRIVMEPFVIPNCEIGKDVSLWREILPGADLDLEAKKALDFVRRKLKEQN